MRSKVEDLDLLQKLHNYSEYDRKLTRARGQGVCGCAILHCNPSVPLVKKVAAS